MNGPLPLAPPELDDAVPELEELEVLLDELELLEELPPEPPPPPPPQPANTSNGRKNTNSRTTGEANLSIAGLVIG